MIPTVFENTQADVRPLHAPVLRPDRARRERPAAACCGDCAQGRRACPSPMVCNGLKRELQIADWRRRAQLPVTQNPPVLVQRVHALPGRPLPASCSRISTYGHRAVLALGMGVLVAFAFGWL